MDFEFRYFRTHTAERPSKILNITCAILPLLIKLLELNSVYFGVYFSLWNHQRPKLPILDFPRVKCFLLFHGRNLHFGIYTKTTYSGFHKRKAKNLKTNQNKQTNDRTKAKTKNKHTSNLQKFPGEKRQGCSVRLLRHWLRFLLYFIVFWHIVSSIKIWILWLETCTMVQNV